MPESQRSAGRPMVALTDAIALAASHLPATSEPGRFYAALRAALRAERLARGLPLADVARMSGLAESTICRIETGDDRGAVDADTHVQLAAALLVLGRRVQCPRCGGRGHI